MVAESRWLGLMVGGGGNSRRAGGQSIQVEACSGQSSQNGDDAAQAGLEMLLERPLRTGERP